MRILIVSDAWFPQVNGVVRTLSMLRRALKAVDGGKQALLNVISRGGAGG